MNLLDKLINHIEEILISLMLGLATILVFAQVVARYAFHQGINWAPEMVEYLFLWSVMLGASYGVRHKVHLGVDVLAKKLPARLRRLTALLAIALSVLFSGGMAYLSYFFVATSYKHELLSVDLQIPLWIPHLALPVGFGLMTFRFVQIGCLIISGKLETVTKSSELEPESLEK